jgi:hypothetical protein
LQSCLHFLVRIEHSVAQTMLNNVPNAFNRIQIWPLRGVLNIKDIVLVLKCLRKACFAHIIRKVPILLQVPRTRVISWLSLDGINIHWQQTLCVILLGYVVP